MLFLPKMANLLFFAKNYSNIECFLADLSLFAIFAFFCHFCFSSRFLPFFKKSTKMFNRHVELTDEQLANLAWVEGQAQEKTAHQKSMTEHVVPFAEHFISEVVSGVSSNPTILEDGYKYSTNPSYTIGDGDLRFNIGISYKARPKPRQAKILRPI